MPLPFGAIGQKCSPVLSTTSQLSTHLHHDREDQHTFQLSSSYTIEPKDGQSPTKTHFGYRWSDEGLNWGYSLGMSSTDVTNKIDYAFSRKVRGDVSVSHKDGLISGSKLHLMVREENVCARLWYDLLRGKPIVECVLGEGAWSCGVQLCGDPRSSPVSYVVGYSKGPYDLSVTSGNELTKWAGTAYVKWCKELELATRASLNDRSQKVEVGAKYAWDNTTTIKTKLESGRSIAKSGTKTDTMNLGLTLQKEVGKGIKLGMGSLIDLRNGNNPKFGCTLSFDA